MASLDEELRLDAEENAREAKYIMDSLPADLKDKFDIDEIYYFMDAILDYYFTSGVLDAQPDDEGFVDIDIQKVADYVCGKASEEGRGTYSPDELFFVAQADMDFQEQNLE
ncbi:hypothetical protein [Xylanibacter muris]|uniref:Uncharacterized protein n=1 Tax=Xylanibacter muris TaxID=2736290 RepID=A0ABX2AL05_9BACT|nr:hypothetical protein [Xylanibacter muris]NPD91893.1 hypothetical protein [Xylanibacter muris]